MDLGEMGENSMEKRTGKQGAKDCINILSRKRNTRSRNTEIVFFNVYQKSFLVLSA